MRDCLDRFTLVGPEVFDEKPGAPASRAAFQGRTDALVVPSLTIYEVFKRVLQQRDEGDALRAVAVMEQGTVVDLDARLALTAARLSLETKLPMADSIVLATARRHDATLWTQDADFKRIPGVRYRPRRS